MEVSTYSTYLAKNKLVGVWNKLLAPAIKNQHL